MAKNDTGYDPAKTGGQFGNKLGEYLNKPAPGPGAATTGGLAELISGADNAAYSGGIGQAIQSFSDTAAGKNIGVNAPGYQAVRDKLASDVSGNVNAAFGANGRYGSSAHSDQLTSGLASALGGLDMQQYNAGQDRQVQAAGMLPGLYSASQAPATTKVAAGQTQDAMADPNYSRFMQLLSAFNSSQGSAGMREETPLWQQIAGTAALFV